MKLLKTFHQPDVSHKHFSLQEEEEEEEELRSPEETDVN
jgi:hypothetical protein